MTDQQLPPYRPARRAIVVVPDEVLVRLITTEARLELPEGTQLIDTWHDIPRAATLLLIAGGDQLDEVAPGFEPPTIPTTIIEPTP